ncbi:MAG: 6-carboxytetrahydropterin synthase [Candidatus Heimdallarchaeota archaeon]|nr:MAG: 6-carboxytetrahydropterin synthase [Candidatus Heimdallarchaeota archaeon]
MNQKEVSSTVAIDRISAHFSASHALISENYEEGLHGHNYQVEIEIEGNLGTDNVIIDFIFLENLLSQTLSNWDHFVLLPSNNKNMKIRENKNNIEIKYGRRFYSIPRTEVKFLECSNVTTEALAQLLGEKMRSFLKKESFWKRIQTIKITIWETSVYRASYSVRSNF